MASTLTRIGDIWETKGQYDKALEYFEKDLKISIDYYGESHPNVASTLTRLGDVWNTKGQYDKALEYFENALKILFDYYGESHPSVASTLFLIGGIWETKGQYDKALEYFEKDLKISIDYYGESHPNVVATVNSTGLVHLRMRNYSKSLNLFDSAIPVYTMSYGQYHRNTAAVKRNRARALMGLCRFDEAEQMLTEAIQTLRESELENDPQLAHSLLRQAEWQRLTGKAKEAIKTMDESLSIFLINPGEHHVHTAEAYFEKASILDSLQDFKGALMHFQKCYDIRLNLLGSEHPDTIEVLKILNNKK